MQFLHYHLLLILILAHLLLNPLIFLLGLKHSLLQRPGSLIDAPQPVLQLLILLLQLFHSSEDVLDLYIIFKRLVYSLQLHHQTPLQFYIHLEDAIDVLSLMRALKQQIQHYPNDLTDGLLLDDASLVAALHLLALKLDQVVLQTGEVGLEVEGEVVEGLEIIGVDPLEEVVEEGRFFELLEVVDDGGCALALALVVYPGQQLRQAVIIRHRILVIKIISAIINHTTIIIPNHSNNKINPCPQLSLLPLFFGPCRWRLRIELNSPIPANSNLQQYMKKRGNLLRSSKSNAWSSSLNDLVTQSEQTISSQASVYTNTNRNALRSGSQLMPSSSRSQDFEDYEDIIADDVDTLFITPEEEKKIQNILEFARKGKINPGNAFDIPVRVIDPQLSEGANMRFWKFSSELLSASISIYDKRVEYMHQVTNRMFDNLIRVHERPLTEEEMEEKQKKQRTELIQMEVGDIGKIEAISSYEIGSCNCQQAEKINIKNLNNQFLPDPLFHKRLQAFDSNTLKSLFMNVFEFGSNSQITFFNPNQSARDRRGEEKMDVESKQEEKIQEKLEEEMEEYEERMPKFVEMEVRRLSEMDYDSLVFAQLGDFKKENVRESLENVQYEVKDFIDQLKIFQENQAQNNSRMFPSNHSETGDQADLTDTSMPQQEFNFQFNVSDHTQLSEDTRLCTQSMPFSVSSETETQSQYYYEDTNETYSEMTPWELEFKGMKLQKRKRKRGQAGTRKRGDGSKAAVSNGPEIVFDDSMETRKAIFTNNKSKVQLSAGGKYEDINLLPQSMNAFTEVYKKKRALMMQNKGPARAFTQQQGFLSQNDPKLQQQPEYPQPENVLDNGFVHDEESTQKTTNFSSNLYHEQHQTQGLIYRSTGIRSLRDIKQKIYKHIVEGRTIRLSELNMRISPNSVMVVFLHLINENNLDIRQVDGEYDIEISARRP